MKRKPIPLYGGGGPSDRFRIRALESQRKPIGTVERDDDTLADGLIAVRVHGDSMIPDASPAGHHRVVRG